MTHDPGSAKVSVVIPAYRATAYIGDAIRSVLDQTHAPEQIIVVNDGCPDTAGLECALEPFRDRIVYRIRPNGGPGAARNTGIAAATGDFIAFLDADDYWAPAFLAEQIRLLETGDGGDLAYCNALDLDPSGETVRRWMDAAPTRGQPDLEGLLSGRCHVSTSTVVARKAALERAGLFDEGIGNYSEDFDLWCRVAHAGGRLVYQTESLVYQRLHEGSLTATPLALPQGALRVLDKLESTLELTPTERAALHDFRRSIAAEMHTRAAKLALRAGETNEARGQLRQAVGQGPTLKRRLALALVTVAPWLAVRLYGARAI